MSVSEVILLDARGRPSGTVPKRSVHHASTPLHLAFSCHVVRDDGHVLITKRALTKRTWPGVVSNACCGHPQPGETLRDAVQRHLQSELRTRAVRMAVALDDFVYRAEMNDGTIEHELCPVLVAQIDGEPEPDLEEADSFEWVPWERLRQRAMNDPESLSPWCVEQIARLPDDASSLIAMAHDPGPSALDDPIVVATKSAREASPWPVGSGSVDLDLASDSVESLLRTFLDDSADRLGRHDERALALHRVVRQLVLAGGKRLRPRFVHWGWRAAVGDRDPTPAFIAGAAIELLHTFALLHDDVMDGSITRRGRPTAQLEFADLHRTHRRHGDARRVGEAAAVLAGDLAFVYADELFDMLEDATTDDLRDARAVFRELRTEVIAGQFLDIMPMHDLAPMRPHEAVVAEETAMKVALLKSARYTVTRPLILGLALANCADATLLAALRQFGDSIGLAFQLRDDVLDLFGDPKTTGKPPMGDLADGKATLLVTRAARLAPPADAKFLCDVVNRGNAELDDLRRCRSIVTTSGALASVEATITACHRDALAALSSLRDPGTCAGLAALAARAVHRRD